MSSGSSRSTASSDYLVAARFTHRATSPVIDSVSTEHLQGLRRTLRNLAKVAARASVQLNSVDAFALDDVQEIYAEVTGAYEELECCVLGGREAESHSSTVLPNRYVKSVAESIWWHTHGCL